MAEQTATTKDLEARRVLEKANRVLLLGTVTLLPLAYGPGIFTDRFNIPKLTFLLCVVAVCSTIRVALLLLGARLRPNPLALSAALMAGAMALSWLLSEYRTWALWGSFSRFGGLVPYLAVFLFAVLLVDAWRGRPWPIVRALVAGAAAVGAVAFVQMLFAGYAIGEVSPTGWVTSTVGHSNFTGGFLAIALPLSVAIWLQDGGWSRWAMVTTPLIASGLIFSGSQAAWAAGAAGVIVLLASRLRSHRPSVARLMTTAGVLIGAASAATVLATLPVQRAVFHGPSFLASAATRGLLWRDAWSVIVDRPFVGWGPDHFAIQGPLHRSVENALELTATRGDDPHSLGLALLANLGVVGLIAFAYVVVRAFASLRRARSDLALTAGLSGALVAYLSQASVSVDEISLRFALWVLLAATAAAIASPATSDDDEAAPAATGRILATTVVVIGFVGAAAAAASFAIADHKVVQGLESFGRGEIGQGRLHFRDALSLRQDHEYMRIYAATLGIEAFRAGEDGDPLIRESEAVFAYLDDFPDVQAIALHAAVLNQWALIEPSANLRALEIYERVRALDPHDPFLALAMADVQLQLGRAEDAERTLLPYERLVLEDFPEYSVNLHEVWAGLAIAQIRQGDLAEAESSLARAGSGSRGCHYLIAERLLREARDLPRLDVVLSFICPPTLLTLLDDPSTS